MNWFRNQKTITQLLLSFSFLASLMGFIGYQGITGMSKANAMLEVTNNRELPGIEAVQDVHVSILELGRTGRQSILDSGNDEALRKDEQEATRCSTALEAQLVQLDRYFVSEQGKALVADVKKNASEYELAVRDVVTHALNKDDRTAMDLMRKAHEIANRAMEAMVRTKERKQNQSTEFFHESQAANAATRNLVIIVILAGIAFALVTGYVIAQMIARPLAEVDTVLQQIANRDLTKRMSGHAKGDFKRIEEAVNKVASNLEHALEEVRDSSSQVTLTAEHLASASQEIASGAQEQAASLEETSATLEEMSATVKHNADSARQANQLAVSAREAAEKGGSVMTAAVTAMSAINTASGRIAEIITTIDEIAFQTNLLALNAAVEAARAGEQGRGFAVVASEVRSLAQRSASAAKEIKGLIQDSVRKVENGSALVNDSGRTLNEIVASVKRVTDIVGEIAAASQQQAAGVEQVAKAMAQMDQVTQANSAQTEEMSSTAEELSATTESLQQVIARFTLSATSSTHPFAPARIAKAARRKTLPAAKRSSGGTLVALAQHGSSDSEFEEF